MLLHPSSRVPLLFVLVVSLAGCGDFSNPPGGSGGSSGSSGSGGEKSTVPTDHRVEGVACPEERGPGHAPVVRDCTQDSECTEGLNGRCISPNVLGPLGGSYCTYDNCFSDADCSMNEPCRCRRSAEDSAPNYCVTGSNCRVDSDCGPGGFCSPSLLDIDSSISGEGSPEFGYFCHTSQDRCLNHSDCDTSACELPSCGSMACGYSLATGHWDCFEVGTH
jgi:hypothetical protein